MQGQVAHTLPGLPWKARSAPPTWVGSGWLGAPGGRSPGPGVTFWCARPLLVKWGQRVVGPA